MTPHSFRTTRTTATILIHLSIYSPSCLYLSVFTKALYRSQIPYDPCVLGNVLAMALRAFSNRMLGNVTTSITLTIRNIKCEVVSSISYSKSYKLEILLLAEMVFKINMGCTSPISILVSLSSMKNELIKH